MGEPLLIGGRYTIVEIGKHLSSLHWQKRIEGGGVSDMRPKRYVSFLKVATSSLSSLRMSVSLDGSKSPASTSSPKGAPGNSVSVCIMTHFGLISPNTSTVAATFLS